MSNASDFKISKKGVLTKYVGSGGDVVIPNSVTKIGKEAFEYCEDLTSVIIPESVIAIGDSAFSCCSDLTSVAIPEGVLEIGESAFTQCDSLESVVIPDGVVTISDGTFSHCRNLSNVIMSGSVTIIGCGAFVNCESLEKVAIPAGTVAIGDQAFYKCRSLTSIVLPESVTAIGCEAFSYCSNLEKVQLPTGIKSVGTGAFDGCPKLTLITAPTVPLSIYTKPQAKLAATIGFVMNFADYLPSITEEFKKYALSQRRKLYPIIFENDYAEALMFYAENKSITAANFEADFMTPAVAANAVNCVAYLMDWKNKHIGARDAEKALNQELAKDPYNATEMKKLWSSKKREDGTLEITSYKGNATRVEVPCRIGKTPVTAVGDSAFDVWKKTKDRWNALKSITEVVLPDGITAIGQYAFQRCSGLSNVTIPDGVASIGKGAFEECVNLANVTLPDSIIAISESAFCKCRSLTNITIPGSVSVIDVTSFSSCTALTDVTVEDGVTSIGKFAFSNDPFGNSDGLRKIKLPSSVISIDETAFNWCKKLTIYAPIGSYAETYAKDNNIPFVAE